MTNISLYPMQDFYETKLSQSYNGTGSTIYVKATPSFTFPSGMKTAVVINPGKTTQQVVIIDGYNAGNKTLNVSSTSVNRGPGVAYTAQTHPVDSVVRISNSFAFFEAIVASLNSKPNTNDNALQIDWYASETARDSAITSPVSGKNWAYINDRGLWTKYIAGSWQDDSTGATANASTTVAGKVELATQAEVEAGTNIGGTGASLVVTPSQINPNTITAATPAAGDKISFSDISDSNKLKSSTISNLLGLISLWYFGDGSDGDVTISTNTTLTRDMYYNNLVINSGVTLNPAGYRIFVKGKISGTGTIARVGNNGSAGGNGTIGGVGTGGAAGTTPSQGSMLAELPAGAGGSSHAGGTGGGGTSPSLTTLNGAAGGNGGTTTWSPELVRGLGGTGGAATRGVLYNKAFAPSLAHPATTASSGFYANYGNSGAAGGGGGGSTVNAGSIEYGGGGGGGGSNGGLVFISCREWDFTGTVNTAGGNGGNGGNATGGSRGGGGGGGGGGNGGTVVRLYQTITNESTFTMTGGTGGTGGTGNTSGANGSNGSTGQKIDILI